MRLKTLSLLLLLSTLLGAALFWYLLFSIKDAQQQSARAIDLSRQAEKGVAIITQSVDLLSFLVQSFTTTGAVRYLDVYYDIIEVLQGGRPAPEGDPILLWRQAARGEPLPPRTAAGVPLLLDERAQRLGFSEQEQAALRMLLQRIKEVQQIEQIAFAATQGLYDRRTGQFVDEGQPDIPMRSSWCIRPITRRAMGRCARWCSI